MKTDSEYLALATVYGEMGVIYYIADRKNKRSFELGKGGFQSSVCADRYGYIPLTEGPNREGFERLSQKGWLTDQIKKDGKELLVKRLLTDFDDWGMPEYIKSVAEKIWTFCELADWNIAIYDDSADSEYDDYPIVDSRYEKKTGDKQ